MNKLRLFWCPVAKKWIKEGVDPFLFALTQSLEIEVHLSKKTKKELEIDKQDKQKNW